MNTDFLSRFDTTAVTRGRSSSPQNSHSRERSLSPRSFFRVTAGADIFEPGPQNQIDLYKAQAAEIEKNGHAFISLKHPHWQENPIKRAQAEDEFKKDLASLLQEGQRVFVRLKLKRQADGSIYAVGKHISGIDINPVTSVVFYMDPMGVGPSPSTKNLISEVLPNAKFYSTTEIQETETSMANSFDCSLWTGWNLLHRSRNQPLPKKEDLPLLLAQGKALVKAYQKTIEPHLSAMLKAFETLPENISINLNTRKTNSRGLEANPYLYARQHSETDETQLSREEKKRLLALNWTRDEEKALAAKYNPRLRILRGSLEETNRYADILKSKKLQKEIEAKKTEARKKPKISSKQQLRKMAATARRKSKIRES
jgi:hypothetical protein